MKLLKDKKVKRDYLTLDYKTLQSIWRKYNDEAHAEVARNPPLLQILKERLDEENK